MSTGGAAMKAIINTEVAVNKVGIIKTPNHPINIFVQEGLQKMLIVNEKIGSVERRKWIRIHIHKNYIRRRRIFDFFLKRSNRASLKGIFYPIAKSLNQDFQMNGVVLLRAIWL
ncbi:hypothetical protein RDI58_033634 [Solanum bulbocastanum]|uniref:Uncharacterized protein n=1 Tax=Solanum bulbocastanum TaxID=147425 RepID=A0AAN8XUC3_SOLBU